MVLTIFKKNRKAYFNLKLYKGINHMKLRRILPRTRMKTTGSFVKVKVKARNYSKPRTENIAYDYKIYFSQELLNELGWNKNTKIDVSINEDNNIEFVFNIPDDGNGYTLNTYKNINSISFPLEFNNEKYKSTTVVEHRIVNSDLIITL